MIIYNTTYQTSLDDARNFVIWMHQSYIPQAQAQGQLAKGRLSRILSHKDEESECFSVQFEVESTEALHRWLVSHGDELNRQLLVTFENRVHGFSTLMEVISES